MNIIILLAGRKGMHAFVCDAKIYTARVIRFIESSKSKFKEYSIIDKKISKTAGARVFLS